MLRLFTKFLFCVHSRLIILLDKQRASSSQSKRLMCDEEEVAHEFNSAKYEKKRDVTIESNERDAIE